MRSESNVIAERDSAVEGSIRHPSSLIARYRSRYAFMSSLGFVFPFYWYRYLFRFTFVVVVVVVAKLICIAVETRSLIYLFSLSDVYAALCGRVCMNLNQTHYR